MGMIRNHYDRRTLAVDFDGTLCRDTRSTEPGQANWDMIDLVNDAAARGWNVVVHSSRPVSHGPAIEQWCRERQLHFHQVACGAKPPADLFIDDAGLFPCLEALDALIAWKEHDDPLGALGDGTMASHWAIDQDAVPENPDLVPRRRADKYRVVIPVTGGMDSTTLWWMAIEAGLDPAPVYVDVGQEYAAAELEAASSLCRQPVWLTGTHLPRRFKHIIPGRNATVIFTVARYMQAAGWWGELWLGNLAGETPAIGGDKSARFMLTTQHLLTVLGYDVHLMSPLRGMDKVDLVRWWQARGQIDLLRNTKSCFDEFARACGKCQTCFRKFVAFTACGVPTPEFDGADWTPHIEKYEPLMRSALDTGDYSRYSPARCRSTLAVIESLRSTT